MDDSTTLLLVGAMALMSKRRGGGVHGDIAVLASQVESLRERERKQAAERARMLTLAQGLMCGEITEEQAAQQIGLRDSVSKTHRE